MKKLVTIKRTTAMLAVVLPLALFAGIYSLVKYFLKEEVFEYL